MHVSDPETGPGPDIRSLYYDEVSGLMEKKGYKRFRNDQLFGWLHKRLAQSFDEMGNLPGRLKEELSSDPGLLKVEKELVRVSEYDGTRKYLFRLFDGNLIESVFMRYEHGNSVCISTQAGCGMGCSFCASAIGGKNRDLAAGEMLGQVYGIIRDTGERVSNVVMMGTGEPLDNYDNSIRFIRLINDERGLNISQRNITLSTCGLLNGIRRLEREDLNITLAISLHAATDEKRRKLMHVSRGYRIRELIDVCREYYQRTGRRLTFEYSLIEGFNDTDGDAAALSGLLKGMNAHINLIPVNPVRERGYRQPGNERVRAFQNKLENNHFNVTIRRELGRDIDGACGQLRRDYKRKGSCEGTEQLQDKE